MKNKPFIFTSLIIALIFFIGIISLLFWRLGILKKEFSPSEEMLNLRKQLEFVQNYQFPNLNNYLPNLSTQVLELPVIQPEEIGRSNLF